MAIIKSQNNKRNEANDGWDVIHHETSGSIVVQEANYRFVTDTEKATWNGKIDKSIFDAAGDLIYGTADNTPARLAKGTARQQLAMNPGATAPEWVASLQSLISASGDLIYGTAANSPARLAKGTDGQVLKLTSGLPSWGSNGNDIDYELLGTITTTAGQVSVEFTNIPTIFDYLKIVGYKLNSTGTSYFPILMKFNDNTNYTHVSKSLFGATDWDESSTSIKLFSIPQTSIASGVLDVEVNQISVDNYKYCTGIFHNPLAANRGTWINSYWKDTNSRITKISMSIDNSYNFVAGCTFKLYGGKLNG